MESQQIISDLAKLFKDHGKPLSRREYGRLAEKPHPIEAYERDLGWGVAKEMAAREAGLPTNGGANGDPCPEGGSREDSPTHPFRIEETASGGQFKQKLAMMAGLKRRGLPAKWREMLGELICATEEAMEEQSTPLPGETTEKESACLVISDVHAGSLIVGEGGATLYDSDICKRRLRSLTEKTLSTLTKRLNRENTDEVAIILARDIVDGAEIYPTQNYHQCLMSLPEQLAVAEAEIIRLVKAMRDEGFRVFVYGVKGNHGRVSKTAHPNSNFDLLLYQTLKIILKHEAPDIPVGCSFANYLNLKIKGHRIHVRHFAPPQGETPAARARFGGWREIHKYDILVCGHLHHFGNYSYMGYPVVMNGCLCGPSDLSESMGVGARPSQTLFGISPEQGLTYRYDIRLDDAM